MSYGFFGQFAKTTGAKKKDNFMGGSRNYRHFVFCNLAGKYEKKFAKFF